MRRDSVGLLTRLFEKRPNPAVVIVVVPGVMSFRQKGEGSVGAIAMAFDDLFYPPADGWTVEDLDELPDDGVRRELIDGVLHVAPSPWRIHQTVAALLTTALYNLCPPEFDVTQAVEILFGRRNTRIPDILVTTSDAVRRHDGNPSRYRPADVALAVEIVSPSTVAQDRVAKPAQYAAAGIPLYWRVDLQPVIVHAFALNAEAGVYVATGEYDDVIEVDRPWPMKLRIADFGPRR